MACLRFLGPLLLLGLPVFLPAAESGRDQKEKRERKDLAIIVDFPQKPILIPNYRSFWYRAAHLLDFDHDGRWVVGHTGVILVNGSSGVLRYFDFGRYDDRHDLMGPRPEFYGVVRSEINVPQLGLNIRAKIDEGWITNLDTILIYLVAKAVFKGYDPVEFAVVPFLDYNPMIELAREYEERGFIYYGAPTHLYCTSFVREVIRAGGSTFGLLNFTGRQTVGHVRKKYKHIDP